MSLTETKSRDLHVVSIDGPITRRPSGRFRKDGDPITVRCAPYWVVRVLHGSVLQDHRHDSAESAAKFSDGIKAGKITESWSAGRGFHLVTAE